MKNFLNSIKLTAPRRNQFDLTHGHVLSMDMGNLVPTLCMECIPGDKFNIDCETLVRFAPMVAPVMHRFDVYMHYYFVPNRIIWPNWEKFITGHSSNPVHPYIVVGPSDVGQPNWNDLYGYLGIPKPGENGIPNLANEVISALPFAAYQCIYHEMYRDQNLVAEFDYKVQDGDNSTAANIAQLVTLRKRAWEHDYFTACLPFAQKGSQVDIPLGDVILKPNWDNAAANAPLFDKKPVGGVEPTGNIQQGLPGVTGNITNGTWATDADNLAYNPKGSLETEATTINELRRAFSLQKFLERSARAGSRYVETILGHFGVRSSDKRLQRPEYITGTSTPVSISEVLNTTGTTSAPQGAMAGHALSVTKRPYGKSYFCEEHGYIIGIMSVRPKTGYQQGIPKHFLRTSSRLDYFWPEFAHLGEQAVENREIFAYQGNGTGTFGYLPMAAAYRTLQNRTSGDFRSSLDFWHLNRIFTSMPSLNQAFVECNPGKRIFAVTDPNTDSLWCHVLHKIHSRRAIPKYGTPSNY